MSFSEHELEIVYSSLKSISFNYLAGFGELTQHPLA